MTKIQIPESAELGIRLARINDTTGGGDLFSQHFYPTLLELAGKEVELETVVEQIMAATVEVAKVAVKGGFFDTLVGLFSKSFENIILALVTNQDIADEIVEILKNDE